MHAVKYSFTYILFPFPCFRKKINPKDSDKAWIKEEEEPPFILEVMINRGANSKIIRK